MKFDIINTIEHENGDVTWEFEHDDALKSLAKAHYNRKRYSNKLGLRLIIDGLHGFMKQCLLKGLNGKKLEAKKQELEEDYIRSLKINGLRGSK
jgi:hypothetical protein